METFGERLRRLREERGISVNELGRLTGKDPGGISRIERGERWAGKQPPTDDVALFADAIGVSFDDLRGVAERRAPYLSDAALLLKVGAEPVAEELLILEDFAMSAANGKGNLIPQNYDDMRELRRKAKAKRGPKKEQTIYILRVSGTCMTPTLNDGDMVWLDTTLDRSPTAIVLAVKGEHEAHIKRLVERKGKRYLEADDGWSAPLSDDWRIVARAFKVQRALA